MGHNAIKLELMEWLTKLEDNDTLDYLKIVKDSNESEQDWWKELPESVKAGIQRGLDDVNEGRTVSHNDVKLKYGL
ncbi:MAG: hypothetical protein K0M50_17245 [Prolixibacteraceae bacterium]|jgi:hypothetical protein|nr:hypothetical protein [Prolixibacteraceae bacterium]